MRILGWVLGGLFLTDGVLALTKRQELIKWTNSRIGKRLPGRVEDKLKKATNVNDTALTMMGINNLIAGAGMVLVASLVGLRRRAMAK